MKSALDDITCGRCGNLVSVVAPAPGSGAWRHLDLDLDADHTALLGTPPPDGAVTRERWTAEHVEEPVLVVPAPELVAEPLEVDDDRVPRGARVVANRARAAGWGIALTYSIGPLLNVAGTKILSPRCHALVLKGQRPGVGIFDATWLLRPEATDPKWAFDTAWCSTSTTEGFHKRDTAALKRLIGSENA